jgi:hypothetical protein
LLKQKYQAATDSDLKEARTYVYGGTVIPDIGYYPFGNMFFTDLIHYVRTGDFIQALLDECYSKLLGTLEDNKFQHLSRLLKDNLLEFYINTTTLQFPEKKSKKLSIAITQLKAANAE